METLLCSVKEKSSGSPRVLRICQGSITERRVKVFLWSLGMGWGREGLGNGRQGTGGGVFKRDCLIVLFLKFLGLFFFPANFYMFDTEVDSPKSMWKMSRNAR